MDSIGSRILLVRGNEPRESFSQKLKISPVTLARYEKNKYPIPEKFLKIFAAQLGISLEWLMTGNGEMYAQNDKKIFEQNEHIQTEPDETASLLREQVSFLQAQIKTQQEYIESVKETARLTADALRRENDTLREQNETLKKQVAILEEMLEAERRRAAKTDVNGMSAAG